MTNPNYTPTVNFNAVTKDISYYRQAGVFGSGSIEFWYLQNIAQMHELSSSSNTTLGTMYAIPFIETRNVTLSRIAFTLNFLGAAGSKARLGIYKATSNTNFYPGDLVLDAGEIVTDDVIGTKQITISQDLTPNLYFLVILTNFSIQVRTMQSISCMPLFGLVSPTSLVADVCSFIEYTQAYGALPDPFPTASPVFPTSVSGGTMFGYQPILGRKYSA